MEHNNIAAFRIALGALYGRANRRVGDCEFASARCPARAGRRRCAPPICWATSTRKTATAAAYLFKLIWRFWHEQTYKITLYRSGSRRKLALRFAIECFS
jgi:hypothetical protein